MIDSYLSALIVNKNKYQDPRTMSTRSLDYESIVLNSLPSNHFSFFFFNYIYLLVHGFYGYIH